MAQSLQFHTFDTSIALA